MIIAMTLQQYTDDKGRMYRSQSIIVPRDGTIRPTSLTYDTDRDLATLLTRATYNQPPSRVYLGLYTPLITSYAKWIPPSLSRTEERKTIALALAPELTPKDEIRSIRIPRESGKADLRAYGMKAETANLIRNIMQTHHHKLMRLDYAAYGWAKLLDARNAVILDFTFIDRDVIDVYYIFAPVAEHKRYRFGATDRVEAAEEIGATIRDMIRERHFDVPLNEVYTIGDARTFGSFMVTGAHLVPLKTSQPEAVHHMLGIVGLIS
ncbi:MAG: hypothetical protein ACYDHD_02625 [Vulcanimicrobiaceae bacterium]